MSAIEPMPKRLAFDNDAAATFLLTNFRKFTADLSSDTRLEFRGTVLADPGKRIARVTRVLNRI